MRKILRVHMVWGGRHLKIRDVCMDLEPCFKVHNLVVVQLKNTKLGLMTNLKVIFHVVVLFYKLDQICNSPQSVPCSNLKWPIVYKEAGKCPATGINVHVTKILNRDGGRGYELPLFSVVT